MERERGLPIFGIFLGGIMDVLILCPWAAWAGLMLGALIAFAAKD